MERPEDDREELALRPVEEPADGEESLPLDPEVAAPPTEAVVATQKRRSGRFGAALKHVARWSPRWGRWAAEGVCLLVVLCAAWHSVNYVSMRYPVVDSSIYASCAFHLKAGKVLYKEVWEHKVPGVYLLDWLALSVGDGTFHAIHQMERLFAVGATLCLYLYIRFAFSSFFLASANALLLPMYLYAPAVHEGGNLTEEYAAAFVLAAVVLGLLAHKASRWGLLAAVGAGAFLSMATLTKEPFALSAAAWALLVVVGQGGWKYRLSRAGACAVGALLPLAALGIWLGANSALGDFAEVFSYNLNYGKTLDRPDGFIEAFRVNLNEANRVFLARTVVGRVLFLIGLASMASARFRRRCGQLPVVAAVAFAAEFAGTMLSPLHYPHYYMQLATSFLALMACGAAFLAFSFDRLRAAKGAPVAIALLAGLLLFDSGAVMSYLDQLRKPWGRLAQTAIPQYIQAQSAPEATLWAGSGWTSRFYVDSQRPSPVRYFYLLDWTLMDTYRSTRQEKLAGLAADLQANPPTYIAATDGTLDYLGELGLRPWLTRNYRRTHVQDGAATLYEWVGDKEAVAVHTEDDVGGPARFSVYRFPASVSRLQSVEMRRPDDVYDALKISVPLTDGVLTTEDGVNLRVTDNAQLRVEGVWEAAGEGQVWFRARADDSLKLFVDGELAVNLGGYHAFPETRTSRPLRIGPGPCRIVVDYFEWGGPAGFEVSWSADGSRFRPLVVGDRLP